MSSQYESQLGSFVELLPSETLRQIEAHELGEDSNMEDLLYWGGRFSVKFAPWIIRGFDTLSAIN